MSIEEYNARYEMWSRQYQSSFHLLNLEINFSQLEQNPTERQKFQDVGQNIYLIE